jgi:nucleotide-binding universal stress UspA family protein
MFQHLLVAVDGSREASKTIPVAVDLATKFGSKVTVVHVREHERYEGDDVDLGPAMSAEEIVNGAVEAFAEAGVHADSVIRRVRPGDTEESLRMRVQRGEHLIYPEAVRAIATGRIEYRDGRVWRDGAPAPAPLVIEEE